MSQDLRIVPTAKQQAFMAAALGKTPYRYLMYGGAIRGGKTFVVLLTLFLLCRMYPGSRWAIVRKDLPTLRRNLLPAFEKIRPASLSPVNKSTWSSRHENGSEIIFFPESFTDDPELNRWKGLEVNGFVLEEANELQEASFNKSIERAGTWIIPNRDVQPDPLIMLTCNPALGWVKDRFHNAWRTGTLEAPFYYLPATAEDNPHIPEAVRESWKSLPENEYRRFVLGDWDVADDPDQLIKFEWLTAAYDVEPSGGRLHMGIDVARFGNDKTVFAYMRGNELYEIEEYSDLDITRTSELAQARITERAIGADLVGVDVVGLGAGVADNLRANGFHVQDIVSGAAPLVLGDNSLYGFKNLRSQMWWQLRERLRLGDIAITCRHQKLVDDLLSLRYKMSSDKVIQIESKDDLKKRLGRSTDYGDAFVYADFVEHIPAHWLF